MLAAQKGVTTMQTDMRYRLIELIKQSHCVDVWDYYNDDFIQPNPIETLADHLIKNDVVPVVRCSQCRKRYTTECALWFSQLDDKQYFCGAIHNDDFYCSYGERK